MLFGLDIRRFGRPAMLVALVLYLAAFLWMRFTLETINQQQNLVVSLEQSIASAGAGGSAEAVRQEIAEAKTRVESSALDFPRRVEALAIQDHIFAVGRSTGVNVLNVVQDAEVSRQAAGTEYPVVSHFVEAEGQLSNVLVFLDRVNRVIYTTARVERIKLISDKNLWKIQFNIVVYGRRG